MQSDRLKPTEKQLSFQDWEFGLFIHFGIRTFYEGHNDWDGKEMPVQGFNPQNLDCRQWIKTAKDAGVNYAVLVAKHHDGFANWPSKYTEYSVANSPWKDGKGDVVKEFVEACREFGVKPGLYYSPADAPNNKTKRTDKEYDDYFINQISELLTNYGDIEVLWFDGCGSENHSYDWSRIIGEIRKMQPGVRIFNMGDPDFRWVGNEAGAAPSPCYNVVDSVPFSILTEKRDTLGDKGLIWLPAECDCKMRLNNWFFSEKDEDTVKSLDELLGLYYYSVGRGANLLINIGPNREGLLPDADSKRLLELGQEVKRRFSNPIGGLKETKFEEGKFIYTPEKPQVVDHVVIMEDLKEGEKIDQFKISVIPYTNGKPITVYEGRTIGHKAICRFMPIRAKEVTIEVLKSSGEVKIRDIKYYYSEKN